MLHLVWWVDWANVTLGLPTILQVTQWANVIFG